MGTKDKKITRGKGGNLSIWKRIRNFFQKSKQKKVPQTCDDSSNCELLEQENQSLQERVKQLEREKKNLVVQQKEACESLHTHQKFAEEVSEQTEKATEVEKCRDHQLLLAHERIKEHAWEYDVAQIKIRLLVSQLDSRCAQNQANDLVLEIAKQQIQHLFKSMEIQNMKVDIQENVNCSFKTQVFDLNKYIQLREEQNEQLRDKMLEQSRKLDTFEKLHRPPNNPKRQERQYTHIIIPGREEEILYRLL